MEDFSTIIWIVILAAGFIFSAVKKSAKKSDRTPQEAWHEIFGEFETEKPKPTVGLPEQAKHSQRGESTEQGMMSYGSQEVFTPEHIEDQYIDGGYVDGEYVEGHYKSRTGETANKFTANGPKSALTNANSDGESSQNINIQVESKAAQIAKEFNLRKAVIYSELLKPKFDE